MATTYDKASLVMIPSGVKEDKLYSIKPTDGSGDFTFSRGSDIQATRVNSSGLIEKAKVNYVLQSNSFDTTWTLNNASVTGGQSGYDGTSNAWELKSATSGTSEIIQSYAITGLKTHSIYAKAGTISTIKIYAGAAKEFDLSTGTTSSTNAKITSVGGGWYRCEVFETSQVFYNVYFTAIASNDTIYIQDAQVNYGLIAQDYVETTTTAVVEGLTADLPRLDYSGGASCPSLLLEPSRTNSILQSEYFEAWDAISGASGSVVPVITSNYANSPEGVQNASRIQFDKGSGTTDLFYSLIRWQNMSSAVRTYSVYMKSTDGVSTYDVALRSDNHESFEVTGEWQRFDMTSATAQTYLQLGLRGTWGTSDTADILIYGAVGEAGSYPTSYIPTYGTAAFRSNEHFNTSVDLQTSGILGSTWTFLYDNTFVDVPRDDTAAIFLIQDASGNSARVSLNNDGSFRLQISRVGAIANVSANKIIGRYDGSSVEFFADGVSVGSASALPNEFANLNLYAPSTRTAKKIKLNQVLIFPTALTDAECIALTTI